MRGSAVIATTCGGGKGKSILPRATPCYVGVFQVTKLVQDVCGFSCVHQLDWSDGTGARRLLFLWLHGGAVSCVGFFFSSFYVSVDVRWVVANVVDSGCGNAYNGGRNVCVAQGFLVFDERRTRLFPVSRQSTYAPPHCALSLQVPSINCVDSFQLTFYACPLH